MLNAKVFHSGSANFADHVLCEFLHLGSFITLHWMPLHCLGTYTENYLLTGLPKQTSSQLSYFLLGEVLLYCFKWMIKTFTVCVVVDIHILSKKAIVGTHMWEDKTYIQIFILIYQDLEQSSAFMWEHLNKQKIKERKNHTKTVSFL